MSSWIRCAALGVALFFSAHAAMAVTLELVPSASSVPPGGPVDIDVVVSGLADGASPSLGAFAMTLLFDDSLFTFTGVSFGPSLGTPPGEAFTTTMAGAGTLMVTETSLLPPATLNGLQSDSFVLFTASFTAMGAGSGAFDLMVGPTDLADENANALPIDGVTPTVVSSGGVVEIPTLSEWGMLILVALLLGGGLVRLRRVGSLQ